MYPRIVGGVVIENPKLLNGEARGRAKLLFKSGFQAVDLGLGNIGRCQGSVDLESGRGRAYLLEVLLDPLG